MLTTTSTFAPCSDWRSSLRHCLPTESAVCTAAASRLNKMATIVNSFSALSNLSEEEDVKDGEISFKSEVAEAVKASLLDDEFISESMQHDTALASDKANNHGTNSESIARLVVKDLLPVLVKAITSAVSTAVDKATLRIENRLADELKSTKVAVEKVKRETQKQAFEMDKLEQYSRRENVKISGIPVREDENTNQLVVELASKVGVDLKEDDISVSHRLPQRNPNRPKPILVKFVRRDKKTALMKAKKTLRTRSDLKHIYIDEDLTRMRSTILRELRKEDRTKNCWSIDGKILCKVTENGQTVTKFIDSPDHLTHVGWSEEKIKELGLHCEF